MATGDHIKEPVCETRREDETEKTMDQASNFTSVEENIGASHTTTEPPDTLEADFDVKDSVKGNEGSASTIEGEKFLKSPSAGEVYFEENNLAEDACQVTENAGKMATEHETDIFALGEAKLDAEESNGLEKGLASALEAATTKEVGHDESIHMHEVGLSENKEDRESTILEKEEACMESLNVNPEDTTTCAVHDTETTSTMEEKSMASTPQVITGDKIEQTTFDTNKETPEKVLTIVPNKETEQKLSIDVDASQMKTDKNLDNEIENPESPLIHEGKLKDEESTQNELFETKDDTERVIQKREEVIEKRVESSPVDAAEVVDIKASTSDQDMKTSVLENQIPTENPQEIEGDKSECKTTKETLEEQAQDVSALALVTGEDDSQTKYEAHMEKESEKPFLTDASPRDANHDETTPVNKAKTEHEEPSKSDLYENKDDTKRIILVEEPIMEKHLESLYATPDDIKECGLVQDTETKSSIKEKLLTATSQEIRGDKIEQTSFDTKEDTPEDISVTVSNEETEQNTTVEVPFVTQALTIDNELAITEGKLKCPGWREEDLLENKNETESELLNQEEVMEKPVESLQLANEVEDTKVSTSDHNTKTNTLENQMRTENPQETVGDEMEREEAFMESLNVNPEDTKTRVSVHDTETTSTMEEKSMTSTPQIIPRDEIEQSIFDTNKETPENVSTILPNEETEQNLSIDVDDSHMKIDKNLDNELENPESPLIHVGKIKNEESTQFETKDDTERMIPKHKEVIEKCVESTPVDASEVVDIKASTSDQDMKTNALENQILTENPQEIEGDKSECKRTKETLEEQAQYVSTLASVTGEDDSQTKCEAHMEKESKKPFFTDASTRDASHDETTPVNKAKTEHEEPSKYDKFENKDDTESIILVEELIVEKHLESLNATPDVINECGLVQDTETKSSIKEKLLTATSQEIRGDKIEQTSFDTKKDTPEDISIIVSNEETEQNTTVEVPFVTEALTIDNELAITERKSKDEDWRKEDLLENKNDTESEWLNQEEVMDKPVESLQLANEVEDTKVSTSDHDTKTNALENPQETVGDEMEKEEACMESLNVNPEDTKTCVTVHDTATRSIMEEKSMASTPQVIPGDEIEQSTFDRNKETPENVSTIVPNEETEQNLRIDVDDSQMKNDKNLDNGIENPESPPIHEGKIKDEESTQKELLETKDDTERVIPKCEEVIEKRVESSPVDASVDVDIKASTSGEDMKTSALENQIPNENPQQIEGDKSKCKTTKETLEEQDVSTLASVTGEDDTRTKCEAYMEKESEKPFFIDASTRDTSHDETTPLNKVKTEHEEPSKSDLFENKNDTKGIILVEEPIMEKHWESLNTTPDDIKECNLVQDTETNSSTKEKLLTTTSQEIWGDKIEQTSFDTKEDTPEDISIFVSNEKTEQNTTVEVPFVTEALTIDNELAITEGKIKDKDRRKEDLLENKNDTESELLNQEVMEKPVESLQLANDAEDTKVSTSDHNTITSALKNQIRTENPQETVDDETKSKTCEDVNTKKETLDVHDVLTIESNDDNEENSVIEEDESEKPLLREESTRDAAGDEPTYTHEDKTEGEDQRRAELFENPNSAESGSLIEESTIPKLVESPQVDAEDVKTHVSDKDAERRGLILAFEENSNDGESTVKYEVMTEYDDQKEDELCDNEKNPESSVLLEAAQTEMPSESLQETLPSTIPQGFLDDDTEEETIDAIQKDEGIQNVTTVSNVKIEENSLIQMDGSQIQHEEYLEKEHEIPSGIEALTKYANDDELIITDEDNIEHEDLRKVELLESKKDTEIILQEKEAQIETHIKSSQVAIEDNIASDSYQGTETTKSREERTLNENEIVHEETEVERLDTADTKKETPEALDVAIVLNDFNEENSVIVEDDSQMKNEEKLVKESEKPSFIEASRMDASGDEPTNKSEDITEGEEQKRAEFFEDKKDTESILLKEEETAAQPLESPQVEAVDITIYVSDQGMETTGLVEVFKGVANDDEPAVKRAIETEEKVQKKDELCDNEKIPDSTLILEVAQMEKPFESLKEALPTLVLRVFLDEKTIVATEKDKEIHEIQNVTIIVPNENFKDDSLPQVDGSQMQRKECSHEESEITPIIEASTKNVNDDDSINVQEDRTEHEDLRKDELVETKEDPKITSQKEEIQAETPVKSLQIAAEDIIESDSCQETEIMSSQEERILKEEEIVREQIEVETLDTADTKAKTPEAQDVSTIVPNYDSEEYSATRENDLQMKNEDNLGKECGEPSAIEASAMDASVDELTNKHEDKIEGEEQTGAELIDDKKDMESKLLKEEEIPMKLVESPHVDTEDTKTYVSDEGAETTGVVEAFEEEANDDKSAVKYEVKTVDDDQKEDKLCDIEENPKSGVLLEAVQFEKPIESLQETLPSTVPRGFLDDKTEEKPMDAIEKDKEILDIQADRSQIKHEEYLEEESEIPSAVEASTKHANYDELISFHEKNIEHKDLRKVELLESKNDTEFNLQKDEVHIETPVKSLQVAAEDVIASDLYHGTETTSQEEQIMNENDIVLEQIEVERLDTADTDKETSGAQNFATMLSSENIKENSWIPGDGSEIKHEDLFEKESKAPSLSETLAMEANENIKENSRIKHEELFEQESKAPSLSETLAMEANENIKENSRIPGNGSELKHEELFEKESKAPPLSETLAMEASDEVPEIIHQDKIEDEKLEKVDKSDCDKHEEITSLNQEAPAEKLNESSKEDLENMKDFVSGADATERNLIEVRSLKENPREIVGDHMEKSKLDKDPKEIDEHLDKVVLFENEKHTIAFIKGEEPVKNLQGHAKNDLEEIKAREDTETTCSTEERDLIQISQESVSDQSEDKILTKARETPDFTPTLSDEHAEKKSLIQLDGSQMKHEELSEKESEMLSVSETSFLNSSNNESIIVHEEKIENEHLNKIDKFEDEKQIKIALINDEAPVEKLQESSKRDLEEVKEFVSCEVTETSSIEEQGLTEMYQETEGDQLQEKTIDKVGMAREFGNIVSDENGKDILIPVDGSQINHEELLEKESETPPFPLLDSSNEKFVIVHTGKIGDEVQEKADKFECMESGEAAAEKLSESSKDLEGIKESIACEDTETSSTEEQNITTISQEIADDQREEKVFNIAQEASDFTTTIPDDNTERNLLIEVDASQIKHEEHLEKEREMPSFLMLNTSAEEPIILHHNKTMENAEIILSNEEVLDNSSKDNENIKASVSCEETEKRSIGQQSLIANPREIMGDQIKEKIIDIGQNAPDLTTITSDENAEENLLLQSDVSQIKHEELLEKESETPSLAMLNTTTEESAILQDCRINDQDLRKVDKLESEKYTEATLLEEPKLAEKVIESGKEHLEDTNVFLSCEDTEKTSSIEEQYQTAKQQEIVDDQTQDNTLDSTTKARDFKQTVSQENAGEKSSIQVDESQVKHEIVDDQTQENVLDTAPTDQDFKPASSHEDTDENSFIQVDELQMKHDEILEKKSETPSLFKVDSSNEESRIIYEDITEDENLKKVHDFECEKHEEITSTEEEARVRKVNESSKEDLEDIKAPLSGEDTETSSFVEKQSLSENPQEILSDHQEEKILDIAPQAQNFIKAVSNEYVEKIAFIQEDGSQMVREKILEEEGETPTLSAGLMLNTTDDYSMFIHKNKIENEGLRKVDIFEFEKHVDDKVLDAASEAPEFKIIVLDENTKEKSLNQVESQIKHEDLLGNESKSLSETSLSNTTNEDSKTINEDKIEDGYPDKVDTLECEEHTEFPLTKEEEPVQKLKEPLKEDLEETKAFVSCMDTETTSSMEDQSLQKNLQKVVGDQIEENIIDTTPEPQNLTKFVSYKNTKENLLLEDDESQMRHEELSEKQSEKPSSSMLKTSNEESLFICDSITENKDVNRDYKLEYAEDVQITGSKEESSVEKFDFLKEGPENIKASVCNEDIETTSPIEERILTANPQENLTKDKVLDIVPEATELQTIVSEKNIEENSFSLEDGSQMKLEEHFEKATKMPSLSETSVLNISSDEPTLILDDKIEDEAQPKVNKYECEKHTEITEEVEVENPNSSSLENIEEFVSCKDIETTNSTEQSPIVNPIENVGCEEKVLDQALEAPDFTPIVPDGDNEDDSLIQVDGSQMKHEEPLEEESEVASLLESSLLTTNNEDSETIYKGKNEDEALKNVVELESKKYAEFTKLQEEAQLEESIELSPVAYKDIKTYVSYPETEASALQEQTLIANPQDIFGSQSEDKVIDTADSKEKITENLMASNENAVQDSLIQIDESEVKHEEILEKESEIPYLRKTSTVEANKETTIIHEDMIEEESGEIIESTLLKEGSQEHESVESLQVASEDIKASVSCQNTNTTSSILNADPRETVGDQTDDKNNIAGTREITLEALNLTTLVSNENEVLDSITPQEEIEIKHEEISENDSEVPFLTKISMLGDNKESTIIHEDTNEGGDLKKIDTYKSAEQTENTNLKEEAPVDETMEPLQVTSEPIKASVSCQDTDPTCSLEEQVLTTTPQEIGGDKVEEKVTDRAKTWEKTPEVSSSILVFQEVESNRTGADNINSVMTKGEKTLNDEICASDNVQAKEEEKNIISEKRNDERADKDYTWIYLPEDETDKTDIEVKEIDFSSPAEDTSEITQHDGAKDIPKGYTAKNEFLEEGYPDESTESTSIVSNDVEQINKDKKAETVITEIGAAFSALPIAAVQCREEGNESEDNKAMETKNSLAPESREYQSQDTKLHESPPLLSHVKDSEWEMSQEQGTNNPQSGSDINDDMQALDEGSTISNEGKFLEANSNENTVIEIMTGGKEASAIQQGTVSKFVVHEIQEQPEQTVEAVPEEKGIKSEKGEMKYDNSDDLKINSITTETDKVAPSDIFCSSASDAGQRAVGQETRIVVQEKEQKPGKGNAIEAVLEEKGINTEEDEIKEHGFNVLKENSSIVAVDKVTVANILQGPATDAALRASDVETPEQHGLDEASLKEIEADPESTTDKLTVLKEDQVDNANFDSSVGRTKVPVLQLGDSSESSRTDGEKQKTSKLEKGEKGGNEETAKLMERSESTEMDKPSLTGLLQEPMKEVSKVVDKLIDKKEPTTQKEELQAEKPDEAEHVEAKTYEVKDGEEESGEHQISHFCSDTPVMVDAADRYVKVAHKKSHNILSGVGLKVKQSISKVKKVITGKSSHPKSASLKHSEKV